MIYYVCEHIATFFEGLILCLFLVTALHFKSMKKLTKILGTVSVIVLTLINGVIWENFGNLFEFEYVYTVTYILILFAFSRIMLEGKWWYQGLLILVSITDIFVINLITTICSGLILNHEYSELLLMRNPARIFLLAVTKSALAILLFSLISQMRKRKYSLGMVQSIIAICIFVISIIIGVVMEKMILDSMIPSMYASIIMICFSVIIILFFYILIQISLYNQSEINRIALQTRLHDDEVRINELMQWNMSVCTLRHDLNNHLVAMRQHIKNGDYQNLLDYIEKMGNHITDIPQLSSTNNATLNAILDVKRMICHQKHIDLKCYLQSDLPEFDSYSFCIILGNLMDNAIEAEMKESQREICLAIVAENGYLRITIQNKINRTVLVNGKLPFTSKNDKRNHGLGMHSIAEIISKNNGAMDVYEREGWFVVDILLLSSN